MKNLKKALMAILATVMQIAKAYDDGKIVWREWVKIGTTVFGWVWIFKNLAGIKSDIETATEVGVNTLVDEVKVEFDIPQDDLEATIEEGLSIIMLILTMVGKKVPELSISYKRNAKYPLPGEEDLKQTA